jgi:hypothetical protein
MRRILMPSLSPGAAQQQDNALRGPAAQAQQLNQASGVSKSKPPCPNLREVGVYLAGELSNTYELTNSIREFVGLPPLPPLTAEQEPGFVSALLGGVTALRSINLALLEALELLR